MRASMRHEIDDDGEAVEHGVHEDGDPEIGGALVHVAEAEGEREDGEPDRPVVDEGKEDGGDDDGEPATQGTASLVIWEWRYCLASRSNYRKTTAALSRGLTGAHHSDEERLEMAAEKEFFKERGNDDCAEGDEDPHEGRGSFVHDFKQLVLQRMVDVVFFQQPVGE